ncbi:DUF1674 domain-containing protein [Bradyrhizobium sp. LHD-71]|uniref:DUF1674 domain-containing protein n=1 Tax=Bradyrhizobium sp. LHD-71 TaxID=3072141 RepID=UPI0028100779|nr:DUF1674 domain-containing protein [Bradyrhizobium sp. LHD-71]MDQ8729692.1 DUF1674 domain-containing protein [Bradyrhizobium sp. LHD-71]
MHDADREPGAPASRAAPSSDAAPALRKPLPPAAQRALAEAAERRAQAEKAAVDEKPREFQGPKGPEPTRFGDWERKGIASDF